MILTARLRNATDYNCEANMLRRTNTLTRTGYFRLHSTSSACSHTECIFFHHSNVVLFKDIFIFCNKILKFHIALGRFIHKKNRPFQNGFFIEIIIINNDTYRFYKGLLLEFLNKHFAYRLAYLTPRQFLQGAIEPPFHPDALVIHTPCFNNSHD